MTEMQYEFYVAYCGPEDYFDEIPLFLMVEDDIVIEAIPGRHNGRGERYLATHHVKGANIEDLQKGAEGCWLVTATNCS